MALVAAVLLAAPRKAEADHVLWSATLTVKSLGASGFTGCHNGNAATANKCSTTATLSDADFIFGGTTYTVRQISLGVINNTPRLTFGLLSGQSWPTALLSYSLHVGGTEVSLSSGSREGNLLHLNNPGVSWSAGSSVTLSLENPAATHEAASAHGLNGAEAVWSSTLTVQDVQSGIVRGCSRAGTTGCATHLTPRTFRIGSTTYRVLTIQGGTAALTVVVTPSLPTDWDVYWQLVIDRGPLRGTATYSASSNGGLLVQVGNHVWEVGETVEITLYRPYEDIAAEDARKPASRSGACGSPTNPALAANDSESAEQGLWHCHGDSIYHRHPDWRYRHPAPGQTVRPTPDPNPPSDYSAPATAPAGAYTQQQSGAPAIKTEGFGNWHSHPDGRFHRHAGGH